MSEFAVFEPTEVLGYPAVLASPVRSSFEGGCVMYLGVNKEVVLDIGFSVNRRSGRRSSRTTRARCCSVSPSR